ncbi:hypothetical protein evm_003459 [Chilo suppressalis]|nr:hypothetical protein evm_003459 [Chilo suppressalis]
MTKTNRSLLQEIALTEKDIFIHDCRKKISVSDNFKERSTRRVYIEQLHLVKKNRPSASRTRASKVTYKLNLIPLRVHEKRASFQFDTSTRS